MDKLRARDFNATSLSTYKFSTLYTTLPYNLIKDKLIGHLKEPSIEKALLTVNVTTETRYLLCKTLRNIIHGLVKMYAMRWPFCWTTFLFDLTPSCKDK